MPVTISSLNVWTAEERFAIWAKYQLEMKYGQIGRATGVSGRTVRRMIATAFKRSEKCDVFEMPEEEPGWREKISKEFCHN
jgi:hypothetical protein